MFEHIGQPGHNHLLKAISLLGALIFGLSVLCLGSLKANYEAEIAMQTASPWECVEYERLEGGLCLSAVLVLDDTTCVRVRSSSLEQWVMRCAGAEHDLSATY